MELNRKKISLEMERLGWTQSELARRMEKKRQQINRILKNNRFGVSFKTVDRFADALGLDPKDLIK